LTLCHCFSKEHSRATVILHQGAWEGGSGLFWCPPDPPVYPSALCHIPPYAHTDAHPQPNRLVWGGGGGVGGRGGMSGAEGPSGTRRGSRRPASRRGAAAPAAGRTPTPRRGREAHHFLRFVLLLFAARRGSGEVFPVCWGLAKRGMNRQECWMARDHDTATATIDAKRPPAKVAFEGLGAERGGACRKSGESGRQAPGDDGDRGRQLTKSVASLSL